MATSDLSLEQGRAVPGKTRKHHLRGWAVMGEALKIATASILAHKLRSFLTLIGIIIGVASVMIVGAFISGLETYVTENVTSLLGSNSFTIARIAAVNLTMEEYRERLRTHRNITMDDYRYLADRMQNASIVAVETSTRTDVHYRNRDVFDADLNGTTANIIDISNINVESGRFYLPFEVERSRQVCVIGWGIANELYPDIDPIGRNLKINGQEFRIIGILKKRGSFLGNNMDNELYIPATTYMKMYGLRRGIHIRVKAKSPAVFETAQDEARVLLRNRRHLKPSQRDNFDILSTEDINQSVGQFTGVIATVVTPITMIALVVGGIVIMNIMLVSVTERTKEIGIRKAIGARRRDLLLQFLLEAAILGSLGGLVGIMLSYGTCFAIEKMSDFTLTITPLYIVLSISVSSGIGMAAGVYPAFRAASLDPVVALNKEA